MSWSQDSLARAETIIALYPEKRSAIMPLLYLAMKEEGYLTADGIATVAELTDVTAAQVQSVATFYLMFKTKPVGDHLVSVCSSISCYLLGADDVLHAIEDEAGLPAGESDGELSVEHAECIGACGGAPAVLVNYELIEGVTPDKGRELIRWLRDAKPDSISTEEMQQLFGGRTSFDWAITETDAATGPYPAFQTYGTAVAVEAGGRRPEAGAPEPGGADHEGNDS